VPTRGWGRWWTSWRVAPSSPVAPLHPSSSYTVYSSSLVSTGDLNKNVGYNLTQVPVPYDTDFPVLRIRDPVPFWPLDPGSGIGKKSGFNNPDHTSEQFLELKYLNSLIWIRDGKKSRIPDPGWKNVGSGMNVPDLHTAIPNYLKLTLPGTMLIRLGVKPCSWLMIMQ
jgi:hypothetical protein